MNPVSAGSERKGDCAAKGREDRLMWEGNRRIKVLLCPSPPSTGPIAPSIAMIKADRYIKMCRGFMNILTNYPFPPSDDIRGILPHLFHLLLGLAHRYFVHLRSVFGQGNFGGLIYRSDYLCHNIHSLSYIYIYITHL